MPDLNAIPWTTDELIDYAALVAATIMVAAFPIIYGLTASMRDRLAVVITFATGATATAFLLTAILWPLGHAGIVLPDAWAHWIARVLYLAVGIGKLLLLATLVRDRRARRQQQQRPRPAPRL